MQPSEVKRSITAGRCCAPKTPPGSVNAAIDTINSSIRISTRPDARARDCAMEKKTCHARNFPRSSPLLLATGSRGRRIVGWEERAPGLLVIDLLEVVVLADCPAARGGGTRIDGL